MITPDFAAYAVGIDIRFDRPVTAKEVQSRIETMISKVARACDEAGATLIGHIKCVVETKGKGFLGVSVTDPTGAPTSRGELQDGIDEMKVIVNVLLYGLKRHTIQELVDPIAEKEMAFQGAKVRLEDLEREHRHEHGAPITIMDEGPDKKQPLC